MAPLFFSTSLGMAVAYLKKKAGSTKREKNYLSHSCFKLDGVLLPCHDNVLRAIE